MIFEIFSEKADHTLKMSWLHHLAEMSIVRTFTYPFWQSGLKS